MANAVILHEGVVALGKDQGTCEPSKREFAGLAGYCSRLAGDNLCRCGGNLKGRYCLWTHFPLPPSIDEPPQKKGG